MKLSSDGRLSAFLPEGGPPVAPQTPPGLTQQLSGVLACLSCACMSGLRLMHLLRVPRVLGACASCRALDNATGCVRPGDAPCVSTCPLHILWLWA